MNKLWAQAWNILENYLIGEFRDFKRVIHRDGHRFMFTICLVGGDEEVWADFWCNENAPRYGFRIYYLGTGVAIAAGNVYHIDHLNNILSAMDY